MWKTCNYSIAYLLLRGEKPIPPSLTVQWYQLWEKMEIPAEIVFDWCQTIFIAVLLVITLPLSSFVYYKLLFSSPFSDNYTFKLIAVNGIAVSTWFFLIKKSIDNILFPGCRFNTDLPLLHSTNILSFHVLVLQVNRKSRPSSSIWWVIFVISYLLFFFAAIVNAFFAGMSIHTALFVALNRVKRMLFQQINGVFPFPAMLIISIRFLERFIVLLCLNPFVVATFASGCARLLFLYDDVFYWMGIHGRSHIVSKHKHLEPGTLNVFVSLFFVTLFFQIFFTVSNILSVVVSVATLIVNLLLALLITREGRYTTDIKRQTLQN